MSYKIFEAVDKAKDVFSGKLRKARKDKGYTQEELALELGMQQQTISHLETKIFLPKCDTLLKLSIVLDIPIDTLLGIDR